MDIRLQIFLSQSGISSRRRAVEIIKSGKVRINGKKVFTPSLKVDPEKDKVYLNNNRVSPLKKIYILLHKPLGVTTTKKDPHAARTVMDLLPHKLRHLNPVGRLDKNSSGFVLLTNDGGLINKLTHPRFNVERVYLVELNRRLTAKDRRTLEKGISLDRKLTLPCRIDLKRGSILRVTMREGRKRQIRRMFASLSYNVVSLKRIKHGFLDLGSLPVGEWRFLKEGEVGSFIE